MRRPLQQAAPPPLHQPDPDAAYTVIARKYRPRTFEDLFGQEAMVRTLRNAFSSGRIAHAFMLTGVRGVGKTTTARLLARALNYKSRHPSTSRNTRPFPSRASHRRAIIEGRHMDVLELDAASRTKVEDMRELLDGVRYAPVGGALQGLHHRRSAHAVDGVVQRPPEDPGRAAAARQVHLRHHRDPQGSGDHPLPLSAL